MRPIPHRHRTSPVESALSLARDAQVFANPPTLFGPRYSRMSGLARGRRYVTNRTDGADTLRCRSRVHSPGRATFPMLCWPQAPLAIARRMVLSSTSKSKGLARRCTSRSSVNRSRSGPISPVHRMIGTSRSRGSRRARSISSQPPRASSFLTNTSTKTSAGVRGRELGDRPRQDPGDAKPFSQEILHQRHEFVVVVDDRDPDERRAVQPSRMRPRPCCLAWCCPWNPTSADRVVWFQ